MQDSFLRDGWPQRQQMITLTRFRFHARRNESVWYEPRAVRKAIKPRREATSFKWWWIEHRFAFEF
jgi:hypothetical protein